MVEASRLRVRAAAAVGLGAAPDATQAVQLGLGTPLLATEGVPRALLVAGRAALQHVVALHAGQQSAYLCTCSGVTERRDFDVRVRVFSQGRRGDASPKRRRKLRRYYAFAACAKSSAEDAFFRPAVTIFRMRSSELLFPSSDTQASSV